MQYVKVFVGTSGGGVTVCCVYWYGVHVQPVVMHVCPQFRIAATRPRKVKFCCVV